MSLKYRGESIDNVYNQRDYWKKVNQTFAVHQAEFIKVIKGDEVQYMISWIGPVIEDDNDFKTGYHSLWENAVNEFMKKVEEQKNVSSEEN